MNAIRRVFAGVVLLALAIESCVYANFRIAFRDDGIILDVADNENRHAVVRSVVETRGDGPDAPSRASQSGQPAS
jgi:hypothetical protein